MKNDIRYGGYQSGKTDEVTQKLNEIIERLKRLEQFNTLPTIKEKFEIRNINENR
jgi:hypothetical protein